MLPCPALPALSFPACRRCVAAHPACRSIKVRRRGVVCIAAALRAAATPAWYMVLGTRYMNCSCLEHVAWRTRARTHALTPFYQSARPLRIKYTHNTHETSQTTALYKYLGLMDWADCARTSVRERRHMRRHPRRPPKPNTIVRGAHTSVLHLSFGPVYAKCDGLFLGECGVGLPTW